MLKKSLLETLETVKYRSLALRKQHLTVAPRLREDHTQTEEDNEGLCEMTNLDSLGLSIVRNTNSVEIYQLQKELREKYSQPPEITVPKSSVAIKSPQLPPPSRPVLDPDQLNKKSQNPTTINPLFGFGRRWQN